MIQVRAGDPVKLRFDFVVDGSTVSVSNPRCDLFDPYRNKIGTLALATQNSHYVALVTAGQTVGTYYCVGYGLYQGRTLYAASQQSFEVVATAVPIELVTVEETYDYLGCERYEDLHLIRTLIVACSRAIEAYLHTSFLPSTRTIRGCLENERVLKLPDYPIVEITSLQVDESEVSDYTLDAQAGIIRFDEPQYGDYEITYTYGFTSVPPEVRLACLKLIATLYNLRAKEGYSSVRLLSLAETFSESKLNVFVEIKSLIEHLRCRVL